LVKKTKEHEVNLKIYKYKWKKELEKSEPDKKLISNQIDSFMFMIENSESFHSKTYLDEMTLFSKMVLSYGHLAKLDDEYKEKFKEINKFIKKEWDDRHRIDFF
jgi:hypothetical protein